MELRPAYGGTGSTLVQDPLVPAGGVAAGVFIIKLSSSILSGSALITSGWD